MYALSLLSPDQQTFLTNLQAVGAQRTPTVSLVVGYSLSRFVPCNPDEAAPERYYQETLLTELNLVLEHLVSLVALDVSAVQDFGRQFYLHDFDGCRNRQRPGLVIDAAPGFAFFGHTNRISGDALSLIAQDEANLIHLYRNFDAIIETLVAGLRKDKLANAASEG